MSHILHSYIFPEGTLEVYDDKPSFKAIGVDQVHSNEIVEYMGENLNKQKADGILIDPQKFSHTNIAIKTADCLPILLLGRKIAFIHAGWKGLHNKILKHHLLQKEVFHSAYIAPSIHHYEVQPDFRQNFPHSHHFYSQNDQLYFDLQKEAIEQLELYFPEIKVLNSNICTLEQDEYNSYRRNKTTIRNWNIFKIN